MKGARETLFTTTLVLAACAPFLYVSQRIYAPAIAALGTDEASRAHEFDIQRNALMASSESLELQVTETSSRAAVLRRTSAASAEQLQTTTEQFESALQGLEHSRAAVARLSGELLHAREEASEHEALLAESRSTHEALVVEVAELSEQLDVAEGEIAVRSAEARRMAGERIAWENKEAIESVPRASAQGVVAWSGDRMSGGFDLSLWLARPWQQRLGFKGAYLADEKMGRSFGYAGLSWQKLLTRRTHLDLWAGPYWSDATPEAEAPFDPAAGINLGFALPKFRLGMGIMALATPGETLIGLTAGYTQVGEAIDVYRGR